MKPDKNIRLSLWAQGIVAALSLAVVVWDLADAFRHDLWHTRLMFHLALFGAVFVLSLIEIVRLSRLKRRR